MDEQIAWLRRQFDDDEAYARNAFGDHNDAQAEWREQWSGALNIGDSEDLVITNDSQVSRFMERFDPKRVLAEIDAKRRIIEAEQDRVIEEGPLPERMRELIETDVIKLLAQPYADRPGFPEEWRT